MRTRIVTNMLLAAALCAATAAPAAAQGGAKSAAASSDRPRMEISGGYSYLWEQGTGANPANIYDKGWVVSFGQRVRKSRIAVVGEVGANYRLDAFGEHQVLYAFLAGVRVPLVHLWRFSTFAQALTGVETFRQPGFDTHGMAFQPGGGLDLPLTGAIALRLQGDFRIAHEEGINFKEVRAAASLVIGRR